MSDLQETNQEQPDLRPERVAEGIAAPWPAISEPVLPVPPAVSPPCGTTQDVARLRPERVQERLQTMPEWSLAAGGEAVERVRKLASPMTAADYAGVILREAARAKQTVRVGLEGARVVIQVMAPVHDQARGTIGLKQLDFAAALA